LTLLKSQAEEKVDMTTRQTHVLSCPVLLVYCLLFLTLSGCATYQPVAVDNVPFKQHSQTQVDGNVRVTAVVLTNQEGEQIFGVDLALGKSLSAAICRPLGA
jgi:hypothetical protein